MKQRILRKLTSLGLCLLVILLFSAQASAEGTPGVTAEIPVRVSLGEVKPTAAEPYTVQLTVEEPGAPMPEGGADTLTVTGEGSASFSISCNRLGVYTYTIRQLAGENPDCDYDGSVYTAVLYVTDNGAGGLTASVVLHGEGEKPQEALFVNRYPTPAEHDPPVKKLLTGDTPAQKATFRFTLAAVGNSAGLSENPMPEGAEGQKLTLEHLGAGEMEFGVIRFEHSGQYVYTIREENTGAAGYGYDGSVYTLIYKVTREGDALQAALTVTKDGKAADNAVFSFTNSYKTPSAAPKTGDDAALAPYILLLLSSSAGLVTVFMLRRNREK